MPGDAVIYLAYYLAASVLFVSGYMFRVALESAASESAARGDR